MAHMIYHVQHPLKRTNQPRQPQQKGYWSGTQPERIVRVNYKQLTSWPFESAAGTTADRAIDPDTL